MFSVTIKKQIKFLLLYSMVNKLHFENAVLRWVSVSIIALVWKVLYNYAKYCISVPSTALVCQLMNKGAK